MILHNPIVSGSLTLSSNATFTANNGSVSGSEQIISLLPSGVVSGSSQVSLNGFDTDTLSEGSSNLYYTDTRVKTKLNADGVISGSSQLATTFLEINGDSVFSSSIQVNADTITNFDTNVKAKLNAETVISGSSQVTITESQISDLDKYNDSDFDTRLATKTTANLTEGSNLYYTVDRAKLKMNQDGVISGSSQLTTTFDTRYLNTEGDSVISGSSQISLSGFDTSDLSEDSSNLYYTDTRVKAKLNTDGVISGSTFSSPSQGTVRATINGANTDVDTGLQTGDNVQFANLTLTGNLSVQGNTTTIDSSVVNIGDNILELNYGGSQTTSGIYVTDGTGVSQTSGSFVWDATDGKDYWKAGKLGSESEVLTTSNLVSKLPSGTISGSSQVTVTESQISDLDKYTDSDVKTKLNTETVISGSSQVVLNDAIKTGFDTADVSEHSSKLYYTDARVKTKLNAEGAFSSSAQLGINNNTITFTAGDGLSGGGTITLNQSSDESVSFKVGDGIVSGSDQIASTFAQTILDDTSAGAVRTTIGVDAAGTDNSTDVTLGNTNYLTISGQAITGGTIPLSSGGTGATSAENARTALGVDAAGTDNSTDVTLSSTLDYISISGQEISIGQVDYSTDISNTPTTITPTQAGNITTNNNKVGYTDALVKTKLNAETVISGSGQVNADSIINFDSNVKAKINTENVVSGSTQIITLVGVDEDDMSSNSATKFPSQQSVKAYVDAQVDTKDALSELSGDTDDVSEGSSNLYYTDARVKTKLNAETVISGSSQVDVASTTNYSSINQYSDAKVKTKLNAETVISGSSQITITESQISDLSHYTDANVITVLNDNTVISGSSQITNGSTLLSGSNSISIDGTPVSLGGSVTTLQLGTSSETALAGNTRTISSGEITSISTNSSKVGYTDARVKTKLDADAVSSGSASEIKSFLGISSSDISDVAAFSQSGTYANLRAQGTTKGDVGLGNVTNESKATMFAGAALTSDPTAPTQGGTDDSTKIATTAFVQDRVDTIIGNAGSTLDTLGELSASLAEDSGSLASLVTTVGTKLSKGSNLSDLANTGTARTNLGVDAAGTDNSTDVTLVTTSHDYLSISGQAVTLGQVDYSSDISNLPTLVVVGTGAGDALAGNTRTISSTEISNISDNNDKVTNVSTNLSITGTTAARTIVSSDGTNAVIPIATTSVSGLLSPSLFDEIDANTAKVSDINHNVTTNLSITGTSGARTIVSSDGTDAIIPIATTSVSGLLSPGLFDEIDVNTAKVSATSTNVVSALVNQATDFGTGRVSGDNFGDAAGTSTLTGSFVGDGSGLTGLATNLTVDGDSGTQNVDLIADDLQFLGTSNEIVTAVTKDGNDVKVTLSLPDDVTIGNDLTVVGNLEVQGTTTSVDSTTIVLGDNILALNGSGAALGGLEVHDSNGPASGSLLWDGTNNKWIAGASGSELEIATISGTQTLTNKTINGSQLVDTSVGNGKLTNDGITIAGVDTSLGGTITADTIGEAIGTLVSGSDQIASTFAQTILDDTSAGAVRTTIGVDAAGTDNSTDVTFAGSYDYLTLSGQEITLGQVDYNADIANLPTLLAVGSGAGDALAGNTTTITTDQASAITANSAKNTNVSTDLSITGTTGARTIVSSDGADAIIPLATTSVSGLLSPSLFDEIDVNTAKTGITSEQASAITANTAKVSATSANVVSALVDEATDFGSGRVSGDNFGDVAGSSTMTGSFVGDGSGLTGVASTLTFGNNDVSSNSTVDLKTQHIDFVGTANEIETSISGQTVTIGIPTNPTLSGNVSITGNLNVEGTTTTIDSTQLNIGDRVLELNYARGAGDAGLLVSDVDGSSTVSGSLLWKASADHWTAGKLGSEKEIALLNAAPTANRVLKADSNGLLVDSVLSDDGTDATFSGDVIVTGLSAGSNGSFLYADSNDKIVAVDVATAGDIIQWNGSSFVASNLVDGGTF